MSENVSNKKGNKFPEHMRESSKEVDKLKEEIGILATKIAKITRNVINVEVNYMYDFQRKSSIHLSGIEGE